MPDTTQELKIVMLPTGKIIPYWRNPRRHDSAVDKLAEVISVAGFDQPIVVDKNYVVIKGHARLKAAKKLGMEIVPCIISDADADKNKADRIADNKIQEMSHWNMAALHVELERHTDMKFGHIFDKDTVQHLALDISSENDSEKAFKNPPDSLPDNVYTVSGLGDYSSFYQGGSDGIDDAGDTVDINESGDYVYTAPNDNPDAEYIPVTEYDGDKGDNNIDLTEAPESLSDMSVENYSKEHSEPKTEALQGSTDSSEAQGGRKPFKTLCPYCGKPAYVYL